MLQDRHVHPTYLAFVIIANTFMLLMLYILAIPRPSVITYVPISPIPRVQQIAAISGTPTRLLVPDLGIDIEAATGQFNASTLDWTIDDNRVFYANNSVPVNDTNGTTVIYGHARYGVFAGLFGIQPNTRVIVRTENGYEFEYGFMSMREVMPENVDVFTDQGEPMLVLQTCIGPWDSYRALYSFKFIGVRTV